MISGSLSPVQQAPCVHPSRMSKPRPQTFLSLMYHNVTAAGAMFPRLSPSITSYFVNRATFARHMRIITDFAKPVTWQDISSTSREDVDHGAANACDRIGVQITFDDGWSGSVDEAGPVMETSGLQGLLFVTTDLIGRPGFLTRRELQSIPKSTFQIGSHARSHRLLNRLSMAEVSEELQSSKKTLEDLLGTEVNMLSIPGGATDNRVLQIARQCGYRYVFTSDVHLNVAGALTPSIGRVAIRSTTTDDEIIRWVSGRLGRERLRDLTLRTSRMLLGGSRYDRIRRRLLGETRCQNEMVDLSAASCEQDEVCVGIAGHAREAR